MSVMVLVVVVVACLPDKVLIDGVSADNVTAMPQYQRSRQFKLRAVLFSPCDDDSTLLLPTVVQWTAEPQPPGADSISFNSTSKELIVISNSLQYGIYAINVFVVSQAATSPAMSEVYQ